MSRVLIQPILLAFLTDQDYYRGVLRGNKVPRKKNPIRLETRADSQRREEQDSDIHWIDDQHPFTRDVVAVQGEAEASAPTRSRAVHSPDRATSVAVLANHAEGGSRIGCPCR
jgi:hypothetical protein